MLSRLITRKEQAVLLAMATALGVGGGALYFHDQTQIPDAVPPVEAAPAPASTDTTASAMPETALPIPDDPAPIRVAVAGAIGEPGLYEMREDDRIQDLIDTAGGPLDSADMRDINLAAPLLDGTTLTLPQVVQRSTESRRVIRKPNVIHVPNPPQYLLSGWRPQQSALQPADKSLSTSPGTGNAPLNINQASAKEFESLPGIGPVLARRIVDYRAQRPFATVDELGGVSGIGEKRLAAIRSLVTVN
jgi:competence protein ComEA